MTAASSTTARGNLALHFIGAGAAKFAPPIAQFILLLLVARAGSLDDVGRLALASAASFLCGALAELGLTTTLSMPRVVFGTEHPPLAGTRRLRIVAAAAGSGLYGLLWLGGLGGHDPALLLVIPLPYELALAYGYSGAMNAAGRLSYEIPISIGETLVILGVALGGSVLFPALSAALAGLTIGRGLGLLARMVVVRRMPLSHAHAVPGAARAQLPYALATLAFVVQGQADMLALGFFGALAVAAIYGPLLRTAYSSLLTAEGLSWALFGGANPDESQRPGRIGRRWRWLMVGFGVVVALLFAALAKPFMHFLLNRPLPDITPAVLLFALVIVIRFVALTIHVDILRAGRQRQEVPVLGVAAVLLAACGSVAAVAGSLTGLAAARLASELPIALGFLAIRRSARRGSSLQPHPAHPARGGIPGEAAHARLAPPAEIGAQGFIRDHGPDGR